MANKQILKILEVNPNICEIDKEYPSLKQSPIDRHLCTDTKPLKPLESININQILYVIPNQQHKNDSNQNSKIVKEETEVIELFQYQQEEKIKNKLYRKRRYQLTNSSDDDKEEKRDNIN
jgi:hypothetical protein